VPTFEALAQSGMNEEYELRLPAQHYFGKFADVLSIKKRWRVRRVSGTTLHGRLPKPKLTGGRKTVLNLHRAGEHT